MPKQRIGAPIQCYSGGMRTRKSTLFAIVTPFGKYRLSEAARSMLRAFSRGETVLLAKVDATPDPEHPIPFQELSQYRANRAIFEALQRKDLIALDEEKSQVRLTPQGWSVLEAL